MDSSPPQHTFKSGCSKERFRRDENYGPGTYLSVRLHQLPRFKFLMRTNMLASLMTAFDEAALFGSQTKMFVEVLET